MKQDAILQGEKVLPPVLEPTMCQLFANLTRSVPESPSSIIPKRSIIQGFKVWNEHTTTSPLGLNLSHYKALIANDGHEYSQEKNPSEFIWDVIATIINASIQLGKGPPRYEVVHQLLLEKIPGNNLIEKQRWINIYEAELNLILKYFWPFTTQKNAHKLGCLGTNQHGGRKNNLAHDVAILNEIILDYHRMYHHTLGITQHDNTACFDRTVHGITNICNQKY